MTISLLVIHNWKITVKSSVKVVTDFIYEHLYLQREWDKDVLDTLIF